MQPFIAYYRVSTKKQGQSGLGLEAQLAAVYQQVAGRGGQVIASYQEVEKGKRKDRPELLKALAHARRSKAILVIAKLDRLSRNVNFISSLMEAGVQFVCCDMPEANEFTLHIIAAVAEHEYKMTSKRTREALAARKARGLPIGAQHPKCKSIMEIEGAWGTGQQLGSRRNAEKARSLVKDLVPIMQSLRAQGETLQKIAERLNLLNQQTRLRKPWNHVQVKRVLDREKPCPRLA
jgi:DNA invertase Pin-like site-specific DNA recombinase